MNSRRWFTKWASQRDPVDKKDQSLINHERIY